MNEKILEKIFEFLAYLSSSAQGLFGEPREYGPLRCVDAMRRFIDLIIELKIPLDKDVMNELKELRSWIDKDIHLLMYDPDKFKDFVNKLTRSLAEIIEKYLSLSEEKPR